MTPEQQEAIRRAAQREAIARAQQKSLGRRIMENVIGDNDPTTQNFGEKVGTFLNMAGEAMTAGVVGDEVGAALDPARLVTGESYEQRRDHYRNQQAIMEDQNPGLALTAQIGGGMMLPIAAATSVPAAAAIGAGVGGLYAGMEGEGGVRNRAQDAAFGAVFGGLAGAASVPLVKVASWAARKFGRAAANVFRDKRLYSNGQLTQAGRETLEAMGYNVDDLSQSFRNEFAKQYADLGDPVAAAKAADLGEFGIPAYRHNVTGTVDDFANFERARRGGTSPSVTEKIRAAADQQDTAMRDAAEDISTRFTGGIEGDQADAAVRVQSGLRSARDAARQAGEAAYDDLAKMGAGVRGTQVKGLGTQIRTNLQSTWRAVDPGAMPNASGALDEMDAIFAKADQGSVPFMELERARQTLLRYGRAANRGSNAPDALAMEKVVGAFDERLDELMTSALIDGDPAVLEAAKNARGLWQYYRSTFSGKDGTSEFIQKMIDDDASPDDVVKWLFSSGKLGSGRLNSTLARGIKDVLGNDSAEWAMVKQAAFRQLWQKPADTVQYGPQAIRTRINTFLNDPASRALSREIFTDEEIKLMRRYSAALARMVPPEGAVNYSNTAYESSRMVRQAFNMLMTAIGGGTGGAPGAMAGAGAGEVVQRGSDWLAGRALLSAAGPRGVAGVGDAAALGIVGGELGGATSQMFDRASGAPRVPDVNLPGSINDPEMLRQFGGP